jgi:hypothetical protein
MPERMRTPAGTFTSCDKWRCVGQLGELVRFVKANGAVAVRYRCSLCGRLQMSDLPRRLTGDPGRFPVVRDESRSNPPCTRCGAFGTELHHWAPQALFEDAWNWPTDYLCVPCHQRWHRVVGNPADTPLLDLIEARVCDAVRSALVDYGLAA